MNMHGKGFMMPDTQWMDGQRPMLMQQAMRPQGAFMVNVGSVNVGNVGRPFMLQQQVMRPMGFVQQPQAPGDGGQLLGFQNDQAAAFPTGMQPEGQEVQM